MKTTNGSFADRDGGTPPSQTESASNSGMPAISLGLIYFVLFKHKWKILILALLGLGGAVGAKFLIHPPYTSSARLLIRYVEESRPTIGEDGTRTVSPGGRGSESILKTEIDILTSYDLAIEVATTLGPQVILGGTSGDPAADLRRAAGIVSSGIAVTTERNSAVLRVAFSSADSTLVQPVLRQVIDTYLKRHAEVHRNTGNFDATLVQETDQRRSKLLQIEEELRQLLEQAGLTDFAAARTANTERIVRIQEELFAMEARLAEIHARIAAFTGVPEAEVAPGSEDAAPAVREIPQEVQTTYRQVLAQLPILYRREQELLSQFMPDTPMVRGIRTQIDELEALRTRLEQDHTGLAASGASVARSPIQQGSRSSGNFDLATENAQISALEARRRVLNDQLARVRADAAKLSSLESTITELQRSKELQEQQYRYLATSLERTRVDEALGPGRVSNISELQSPSPPGRDLKIVRMTMGGLAAGGLLLGLALAFAVELFLDQSVKRPIEVERSLGLPLVMTIPRTKQTRPALKGATTPLLAGGGQGAKGSEPNREGNPSSASSALTPWSADHELRTYFDALRNRLIYSFEMRGITRKPKLVAVTSCGADSGVSTVAAGLAASLSETGDGNVLLVDMNPDRKTPQFFHKGDLKVGLDDVLAQETRDDALVRENLYMVSQNSAEDRLSWIIPKKFAQLVPKMKASDFDYIIFDMPPVSQISATPQLARYMDQVLMVVESEKTNRDAARRAGAMLADAGANVGVVLNKTPRHVPAALDSEALGV